jgi:hypothetical protein
LGGDEMKELLIASITFALFILCPRMAGMTNIISDASHINLIEVVIFGTILALPLIIGMAYIFKGYGLVAALAFCIIIDFAAAFTMKEISMKAGVETLIVALFVILGVRVASMVSAWIA